MTRELDDRTATTAGASVVAAYRRLRHRDPTRAPTIPELAEHLGWPPQETLDAVEEMALLGWFVQVAEGTPVPEAHTPTTARVSFGSRRWLLTPDGAARPHLWTLLEIAVGLSRIRVDTAGDERELWARVEDLIQAAVEVVREVEVEAGRLQAVSLRAMATESRLQGGRRTPAAARASSVVKRARIKDAAARAADEDDPS